MSKNYDNKNNPIRVKSLALFLPGFKFYAYMHPRHKLYFTCMYLKSIKNGFT